MKSKLLTVVVLVFAIGSSNAQFSFKNLSETSIEILSNSNNKNTLAIGKSADFFLFPAFLADNKQQSKLAIDFFEGNDEHQRFFQNNNVLYNPKLKAMTLNTEVVNDYFGGFRVGVGFQINSTVENENLTEEEVDKNKLVSSLQNGGGNIFINLKFPILAIGDNESAFGLKSNFYHNTGFELTKFNQADDDFMMTNMTGIVIGGFGKGYEDKMYVFAQAKAGFIYGNSKFRNILSVDEKVDNIIPITHFELGISFSDLYTLKVDMYPFGNYIKDNFPTTLSFIITPKKSNN